MPKPAVIARKTGDQKVVLDADPGCADPHAIAEAIPGAWAMVDDAVTWMLSMNPGDRSIVDALLKQTFLSGEDAVRDTVFDRMIAMRKQLEGAKAGKIRFICDPPGGEICEGRGGYVLAGEKATIHLCRAFFDKTLEEKRWTLIHESAHLSGVSRLAESYYANFGTVTCTGSVSSSTAAALQTADNYARFVWCLTRRPGTVINNP